MKAQTRTKKELLDELTALRRELENFSSTDAKQKEDALKRSEEQYRMVVEFSNDGIAWIEGTEIVYLNRKAYEIFGYDLQDELIGKPISVFIHPDDRQRVLENNLRRQRGEDIPAKYEFNGLRKDGQPIYVEISVTHTTYQGKALSLLFIRDSTDRKQAEAVLQESEKKYRTVLETIEDGYYEINLAGHLTFFNDAMARINGYSRTEMMGMHHRDYTDAENIKLLTRGFNQIYRTGVPSKGIQYEVITKNGEKRNLETSASLIRDPSGEPIGFRGISRDITELRKTQKALSDSEERFRLSAESANDFIYEWDIPSDQLEWFGNAAEKLVHLLEELPTTAISFDKIIHPDDAERISRSVRQHLKTGEPYLEEYRVIGKKGNIIHLQSAGIGVRDEKGRAYKWIGALSDITERKKDEDALLKSIERFKIVAECGDDFIVEWDMKSDQIEWFGSTTEKLVEFSGAIPQSMTAVEKIIHPEDHDRVSEKLSHTLKKASPYRDEFRVIGRGGNIRYLTSSGSFLRDEKGRAYKWIGALSDITKRKKDEEELKLSLDKLHKTLGGIIQAMVLTVECKDPYTAGHQQRVSRLAREIAQEMCMSKDQIESVRMAGAVHDLGKISVPSEILSKPTKLTDIEFRLLKVHPQTSYDILKDIDFPWPIARIALEHHERMDGSGYPAGLKGDELLIESRILMVADVVEAIASHRPYRPALGIEAALEEISKHKGSLFDPVVVEACLKLFKEKEFSFD